MNPELPNDFPTAAILTIIESIRKGSIKSRDFAQAVWILSGFALAQILKEEKQPYADVDITNVTNEDFAAILENASLKAQGKELGPVSWIMIAKVCVRLLAAFF